MWQQKKKQYSFVAVQLAGNTLHCFRARHSRFGKRLPVSIWAPCVWDQRDFGSVTPGLSVVNGNWVMRVRLSLSLSLSLSKRLI